MSDDDQQTLPRDSEADKLRAIENIEAVSYTHLTLPTKA